MRTRQAQRDGDAQNKAVYFEWVEAVHEYYTVDKG